MDSEKDAEPGKNANENAGQRLTPQLNAAIIPPLFKAEVQEQQLAVRVVGLQILVTLVASGAAYGWLSSTQYAIAVLGGGSAAVLNGALLAWRHNRAAMHSTHDAHQQLRLMYFYAAERFLAVVGLLGICLAILKLLPLAVLGGFILGQTVLIAARLFLKFGIKIEDSD